MERFWQWVSSLSPHLEFFSSEDLWEAEFGWGADVARSYAEELGLSVDHLISRTDILNELFAYADIFESEED